MADEEWESRKGKIAVVVDEDLRELIPEYLDNRRKDVAEILAALNRGDFEIIRSLSHKMKGSGGGYGFEAITDIGRTCEEASKHSQAQEIRDQMSRLQTYLDSVEVVYQP